MFAEESFHPDTRALLAYSRALAFGGPRPEKRDADHLTSRLFVFDCIGPKMPIRTFGSELVALFGRDLKGENFLDLWHESEQALFSGLVAAVGDAQGPGVLRCQGETANAARIGIELLITPLKDPRGVAARRLGLCQPLGGEAFLMGRPLVRLKIGAVFAPDLRQSPRLRLVVSNTTRLP